MASDQDIALLDHIIVLVPYGELLDPPKWLSDNFNISDGGKHADGKTENKLIVFKDGTYIELISFINDLPENRSGHWWGSKAYGIVDWAFTNQIDYETNYAAITTRLTEAQKSSPAPGSYSYAPPQTGGRTRPDGIRLEWAVTFPTYNEKGSTETIRPHNLPFYCHDITSRENRVNGVAEHPCGAVGIRKVVALVDDAHNKRFSHYISAVVNSEKIEEGNIIVGTPHGVSAGVSLVSPSTEAEEEQARQSKFALKELVFYFDTDHETDGLKFLYPFPS